MAQLSRARYQRGQTLLETVVATAIAITLLASGVAWSLSHRAGNVGTTAREITALLAQTRALAATSGDGATLLIGSAPCASSSASPGVNAAAPFNACLYAHRPIGNTTLPTQPTNAVPLGASVSIPSIGLGPYAIFVSPSGLVGAAAWSPAAGALAGEPACTTSIIIAFEGGTSTGTLDCTTATFTYPTSGS